MMASRGIALCGGERQEGGERGEAGEGEGRSGAWEERRIEGREEDRGRGGEREAWGGARRASGTTGGGAAGEGEGGACVNTLSAPRLLTPSRRKRKLEKC